MSKIAPEAQTASSSGISRPLIFAMALACGLAVANIYYNQPMLGIIAKDLPGRITGFVPTVTQFGYAIGLFALVPLGDLVERRRLIVIQFVILALALACAALAPTAGLLLLASLAVGIASTVAQQIVPFAAHLSPPDRRGATVGAVLSGVLTGILLSRTLSGFVASLAGWRMMFWLGVPLALAGAALMALTLPRSHPDTEHNYRSLMGSLIHLWHEFPTLRRAAVIQALLFGAFIAFWSILALHLQEPFFNKGAQIAGLFGVVGGVGILAAPVAGRFADKHGPHKVILLGAVLTLVSWMIFALWSSLVGLVVGCVVLDFAVQSALVSNQHIVYALRPEARARLNTLFMGSMFIGGASGSAAAMVAWSHGGWIAVSALGAALALAASGLELAALRR